MYFFLIILLIFSCNSEYALADLSETSENYENLMAINTCLRKTSCDKAIPRHCQDVKNQGLNETGFYVIHPNFAAEPFLVLCDMDSRGGGWTYVLNRFKGNQDFYLTWNDYKHGFGNLAEEFWLGLQHLHELTNFDVNELLIELEDWDSKRVYAHYGVFGIGGEEEGYRIKLLGGYEGDAGDSFSRHAGMKFTTKDVDLDVYAGGNCAQQRGGGWWYKKCGDCHLTGKYMKAMAIGDNNEFKVMFWQDFHGPKYSLKKARMMVRPRTSQILYDNENDDK